MIEEALIFERGPWEGRKLSFMVMLRKQGFEKIYGFEEGEFIIGHDDIDGVEVFFATEASGEVGFGVGGGMESLA